MYITIDDIKVEARIDLSYPILSGREVAVISMFSDNVQCWLKGPMKVLLKTGKEIMLTKAVYMNKEPNAILGLRLKSQMVSHDDVSRTNKLEKVTKVVISLNELDNSDNLEDEQPSNTLFTYYVTNPEYSTCFKPVTLQYKKLKSGTINSLPLKITDQAGNIITNGPEMTVVLHIKYNPL